VIRENRYINMSTSYHDSTPATVSVSEDFKADVREWLKLTQNRATVQKDMKSLNQRIKELKDKITEVMLEKKLDACRVGGGRVQLYCTKSKEALNVESIKGSISKYMATREGQPNDPRAGELATFIVDNRLTKETLALRRSGNNKKSDDSATSELREQQSGEEQEHQDETDDV
jgi:hypothetical protein